MINVTLLSHLHHFIIHQSQFTTFGVVKFIVFKEKCTNGVKYCLNLKSKLDISLGSFCILPLFLIFFINFFWLKILVPNGLVKQNNRVNYWVIF